jgi:hypothetical protein
MSLDSITTLRDRRGGHQEADLFAKSANTRCMCQANTRRTAGDRPRMRTVALAPTLTTIPGSNQF